MPQAVDLILKNGAGTPVDKTFTLLTPAAGDTSVAEWALKEGAISSVFPRITAAARKTNSGSRKTSWKLRVPSSFVDTASSLTKVGSSMELNIEMSVPSDFPENLKNDVIAYSKHLVAHALYQAAARDGLPCT